METSLFKNNVLARCLVFENGKYNEIRRLMDRGYAVHARC